uniref:Predicted GPI-anchored protein 7 (Repressed by TUP1 protein 6) n=1 Tax=Ganoderma boninense TaxID=34458 RepID=A0A5K1K1L3_9APHY|nr:Predicted GPI-anchored protein 7 (Repressed by TUP1 protein 6) [Ganoderma boninense]
MLMEVFSHVPRRVTSDTRYDYSNKPRLGSHTSPSFICPKILLPHPAGSVSTLCAVHDTLAQFPNLNTLSLIHSLAEGAFHDPRRELPKLTKAVRLPLLRHLELVNLPAYIPLFLSHLVFPAHTALVLELASTARTFSPDETAPIPLFSGINPSSSPGAELSLRLYRREGHHKHAACWETHGAGIRSVCVTLPSYTPLRTTLVARFTRELVAALAPAPASEPLASGVTSLTLDPFTYLTDRNWKQLLPELPGLRRLCCLTGRSANTLIKVLGERRLLGHADGADREVFCCPGVAELKLGWNIPYGVKEADWDVLQPEDGATSPTTGASPSDKCTGDRGGDAGSQRTLRASRVGKNDNLHHSYCVSRC